MFLWVLWINQISASWKLVRSIGDNLASEVGGGERVVSQDWALNLWDLITELVNQTRTRVLAPAEMPCLGQGDSFSYQIRTANHETDAETGTAQALFNGQRMEKQKPSLQINFSTQFGWRHHIYRRVEVKGRELERGRNIRDLSENRGVVWTGTEAILLFSPCMGFSDCCHGNCQLSWHWWVCHLACYCVTMNI